MPLLPDAFIHVPMLTGKIIEPEQSAFRISLASFEEWDRRAAAAGFPEWRRSHEDREATRSAALAGRLNADLWVFAYGSLMWDPAIHVAEIRQATFPGFHRRFCLKITIGRGSRKAPSLMAALDLGGECHGLAFRLPACLGKPGDGNPLDAGNDRVWLRACVPAGDYAARARRSAGVRDGQIKPSICRR